MAVTIYNDFFQYNAPTETYGGVFIEYTTTFATEINRLANGGTYPAVTAYVTVTRAANIWAGTVGLPLVAALNAKNGSSGFALMHVCNALAGTSGLSSTDALKSRAS